MKLVIIEPLGVEKERLLSMAEEALKEGQRLFIMIQEQRIRRS